MPIMCSGSCADEVLPIGTYRSSSLVDRRSACCAGAMLLRLRSEMLETGIGCCGGSVGVPSCASSAVETPCLSCGTLRQQPYWDCDALFCTAMHSAHHANAYHVGLNHTIEAGLICSPVTWSLLMQLLAGIKGFECMPNAAETQCSITGTASKTVQIARQY